MAWVTMDPNAEIPKETLTTSRMMLMVKGSVEQLVNGAMEKMEATEMPPGYFWGTGLVGYRHALILDQGAENAVKAGPNGAEFCEIYAPMRLDYLEKAGYTLLLRRISAIMPLLRDICQTVFNYYDVQRTVLTADAGPASSATIVRRRASSSWNPAASSLFTTIRKSSS